MKTVQCSRPDRRQLSAALADQRSRYLLSCLQDSPATVRDLAVALAATELGCARSALPPADRRQYRRQLDHQYLPRLTDAGLLERSPDGFVRSVPGVLEGFDVRFPSLAEPADPSWAAAAAVLRRPYRYPLVAALAEAESLSLSRLADRLADTDEVAATPRELAVTFHHVDLPKLASVDLLSYDADARTVTSGPAVETVL